VTGIEPAALPPVGFLDQLRNEGKLRQGKNEADFVLVGYGGTLAWPPPEITYEDYRQYAESEFQALLKAWLRMSQNRATGDGGTCFGDSEGLPFGRSLTGPRSSSASPPGAIRHACPLLSTTALTSRHAGFINQVIAGLP